MAILAALGAPCPVMAVTLMPERPSTCTPALTIQNLGCTVSTVSACEGLGEIVWWTEKYDQQGTYTVKKFTKDFVEAFSIYGRSDFVAELDLESSSSTPPRDVAETGEGEERIRGTISEPQGNTWTSSYRQIRRVDPPLVLSGTTLIALRFFGTRTVTPPPRVYEIDFMNYFESSTGVLMGGESLTPDADGKTSLNGRPAALFFPGEPGFDVNIPTYDCPNISFNFTDEKADQS